MCGVCVVGVDPSPPLLVLSFHGDSCCLEELRFALRPAGAAAGTPSVFVMCTQLTGGCEPLEDAFFAGPLADERGEQTRSALAAFDARADPDPRDLGLLCADLGASAEYIAGGPMASYFRRTLAEAEGARADAASKRNWKPPNASPRGKAKKSAKGVAGSGSDETLEAEFARCDRPEPRERRLVC